MPWMWIGEIRTTITAEGSDIWLEMVGIEEQGTELGRKEDWNIVAIKIMGVKEKIDRTI